MKRNVDLKELLSDEAKAKNKNTVYDLIANIVHDGDPSKLTQYVYFIVDLIIGY